MCWCWTGARPYLPDCEAAVAGIVNIDTAAIRRLRDALLDTGRLGPVPEPAAAGELGARRELAAKRVAPFVETMYLAMMADGAATTEEIAAVTGAARILTDGLLQEAQLEQLLAHCAAVAAEHGVSSRLQMLGARLCADRMDRETAFSLAAAVAMADKQLDPRESELINDVAEWYGISSRRLGELLGEH